MNIVDVHAHMDIAPLHDDIEGVLERAKAAGIKAIIANGTNPESNRKVLDLAAKYPMIKPALGLYPTEVHTMSLAEVDAEIQFILSQDKVVAFGEVGLDQKWSDADKENSEELFAYQVAVFRKVVQASIKSGLPLIIHSRKAELEVIEILEELGAKKVVMHCFMGKKKFIQRIIDNGWFFSIPCIVTKLDQVKEIVTKTPLKQLLTETDAPYLAPAGKDFPNESANIVDSLAVIAQIKKMEINELADQLFMNYQKLF
jgi:TatD DNase family protein